jgi:hypothetical protein
MPEGMTISSLLLRSLPECESNTETEWDRHSTKHVVAGKNIGGKVGVDAVLGKVPAGE